MDPDVEKLYQDLINNKYSDLDDYLTSYYEEDSRPTYYKPKAPAPRITFGGVEITDFDEDMDLDKMIY